MCFHQRRALLLFAIFNSLRFVSYKFEMMRLNSFGECSVRKELPGLYMNGVLSIPLLSRLVSCGYEHGFYQDVKNLFVALLALFSYLIVITISAIDMTFGPLYAFRIFRYPIVYPYFNFPLVLFGLHHFVLRTHRDFKRDVFEVIDEDMFLYICRYQCLNLCECAQKLKIYKMTTIRPSILARNGRINIAVNIHTIDNLNSLDENLKSKLNLKSQFDEKNIYY
ncbi:unnamed protein product [Dracunculus medinensis]|uniref:Uncharacterized protein n=1 Tax=Dracunculus medinensis TaxID=318479 RepID=A0A0N4U1P5_DRAME|nr:unnamed protein product [Dracunculus medinensis]